MNLLKKCAMLLMLVGTITPELGAVRTRGQISRGEPDPADAVPAQEQPQQEAVQGHVLVQSAFLKALAGVQAQGAAAPEAAQGEDQMGADEDDASVGEHPAAPAAEGLDIAPVVNPVVEAAPAQDRLGFFRRLGSGAMSAVRNIGITGVVAGWVYDIAVHGYEYRDAAAHLAALTLTGYLVLKYFRR